MKLVRRGVGGKAGAAGGLRTRIMSVVGAGCRAGRVWRIGAALVCACLAVCARASDRLSDGEAGERAHTNGTALPQPERLVAIGDIHGDLQALRGALRLAGVLHARDDRWVGGRTVVVQVGDLLDRGDDELAILALVRKLQVQARRAGGAMHVLYGNHEHLATTTHGFRYATPGAFANYAAWEAVCREKGRLTAEESEAHHCGLFRGPLMCPAGDVQCQHLAQRIPAQMRSRFHALYPGGCISKGVLAQERAAVLVVGDTVFVHAVCVSVCLSVCVRVCVCVCLGVSVCCVHKHR